jgi:hypothetical protein
VSVSPDWPHPGPISTVGRTWPSAEGSGNQWIRIFVPSNDVTSKSDGIPLTVVAFVDCQVLGGWHIPDDAADAFGVAEALE